MIEVTIDSVRVSLMSQHRVVVLKESDSERFLPIWIGSFEADAITLELQGVEVARPLTHDLLKRVVTVLGARVSHVLINDLQNDTYYARIFLDVNGQEVEIDSRPSDSIALAVRAKAPIFVAEEVMERAGIVPEEDVSKSFGLEPEADEGQEKKAEKEEQDPSPAGLDAFKDFIEGLDMEDLSRPGEGKDV